VSQLLIVCLILVSCSLASAQPASKQRVTLQVITDESEAVLAILAKKKAAQPVTDADWQRVFMSEGYVRLRKRENSMRRKFADEDFKTFVLSNELSERAPVLKETLEQWKNLDVRRAGQLALAYLPATARIQAKIYPVIKPRENSFVFDLDTDPAIFLFLNPKVTPQKFENTLAHELHHIGFGTACPGAETAKALAKLEPNVKPVFHWAGAFGEGFAMLAAAGGPTVHPHAVSEENERAEWDKNSRNFNSDLKLVEKFFLDVLAGRLNEEQRANTAASFFGVQGPWYTIGWKMAVTIESAFGRARLIECMCDQRLLFTTYNDAAREYNRRSRAPLALWSDELLKSVAVR
jgi:hypothetical protein